MKKVITIGILLITTINLCAQTYNPSKAAEYASFWCDKRNTLSSPYYNQALWGGPYIDYSLQINGGKDCAAFVSQCLIAGGLSLAAGTNGNGAYVKPDKVIAGAAELVKHLDEYQSTTKEIRDVYDYYAGSDIGDPMFLLNSMSITTAYHSYMCSMLDIQDGISEPLFSAHTNDVCNTTARTEYKVYFHIKSTYPDHCFDCEKNYGEDEIDCGGSCPPCEHAPKQKSFETPTNNLPPKSYALEKITAGNAAVHVLSGQSVGFYTLGEIVLLPGFEAQEGSEFNAQIKGNIYSVTADCDKYCDPTFYLGFVRWRDWYTIYDIANVKAIAIEIWINTHDHRLPIFYDYVEVTSDGKVELWDLITVNTINWNHGPYLKHDGRIYNYYALIWVYPCQGGCYPYIEPFVIYNPKGKLGDSDSESGETENPVSSPPQNPENTIFPNGNTTPSFSILPNPNPGTFQLETNFPLSTIGNLKITNLMGTPVYETQNVASLTIQLQNPTTGTFFVVMVLKDGTVLSRKMVVQ